MADGVVVLAQLTARAIGVRLCHVPFTTLQPGMSLLSSHPRHLRVGAWLGGLAVTYGGLASLVFVAQGSTSPVFFPAAGVTLGFMFLVAPRARVAGALVIAAVEVVVDRSFGVGASTAVLLGLANGAEPLVGAALLERWFTRSRSLPDPWRVVRFAAAALVATAASSTLGGSALSVTSSEPWWSIVAGWWLGDLLGIMVMTPVVLLVAGRTGPGRAGWLELVASNLLAAGWAAWLFFGTTLPLSWSLFPLVGLLAVRYGSIGATMASGIVSVSAFAAVAAGEPFLGGVTDRRYGVLLVHLMLVVTVLGAHLLAAEVQYARRSADAAADGEASLRAVIDQAPVAIIEIDGADSTVLSWNATAEHTFGVPADQVIGRPLPLVWDVTDHIDHRDRAVREPDARRFSVVRRMPDGRELHLDVAVQPRTLIDGRVVLTSIINDRTRDIEAQESLRRRLATDPLTGLASRTAIDEQLLDWMDRAGRGHAAIAAFCDLDGFKAVNDALGHRVGDALLVDAADRLRRCVRPDDLVARMGGDEFVILAALDGDTAIAAFTERMQRAFAEPFAYGDDLLTIGISVGWIEIGPHMRPDELLAAADAAMYDDKRRRREHSSAQHGQHQRHRDA